MRITTLAAAIFFLALSATAGTIGRIEPSSIPAYSDEYNIGIYGFDLGSQVVYEGPAGRFAVEALSSSPEFVVAAVPVPVLNTPGSYAVSVSGSNAVSLQIEEPPSFPSPLQILGQDPVVVEATSPDGAIVHFEIPTYGGRDPAPPTVTCNPPSGSQFRIGPTNVFCVATNNYGERAEGGVYVYVYDGASPVLDLPDDITVAAEGPDGTVVTFEATASDAVDGDLPVTCAPASGSRFPIGVTTVECTATDSSLNPTTGTFTVTVEGDGGGGGGQLTIQVPDDFSVEATSSAGAEVTFTVTASGSDDPNPQISCDPVSGSVFALGTTTVLCSATDTFGDRAEGEFDVSVVDTTPPSLILNDITAEADSGGTAEVTYTPVANDTVDGSITATCTPPSGTRFPLGETTVQCSATDSRGNTANGSFVVRVVDSTAPHIASVTADPNVLAPANHKLVDVTVTVEASDANDPMPQCSISTVTANEPILAPGSGNTGFDWQITGPLTLQLRAERSGEGMDRVYTIWVTCSDVNGNESTGTVNVTVPKGKNEGDQSTVVVTPSRRRAVGKP